MALNQTPTLTRPSTPLELMTRQLAAIEAWNLARRTNEAPADSLSTTREARMDLSRRLAARRREQAALIARADAQLHASGQQLAGIADVRAVIAHRDPWVRTVVTARLGEHGITLVDQFEDGADAAGTVVAEQPDLVLVEDRLPTMPGITVLRRVRSFAPRTVVAAHVLDGGGIAAFIDAGAHVVTTRRTHPTEIADSLLAALVEPQPTESCRQGAGREPGASGDH